jgi:hypothetical protein
MKNANAKSASAKSTVISDACLASVLKNSNWAKMERDAKNVAAAATKRPTKKSAANVSESVIDRKMVTAHDVTPKVVSSCQKIVNDCAI